MSETHPPILDEAVRFVREGDVQAAIAYEGFEKAHRQVSLLDGQLDSAVSVLNAATELIEKYAAAYDIGEDFTEQALQKHISQRYGENNTRAARGEVRLKRGLQNLRSEREVLLGIGTALLGAAQQFIDVRGSLEEVKGTLQAGMGSCTTLRIGQAATAENIKTYIVNRDIEHGVGQNIAERFDAAAEHVQPTTRTQQPAQIAKNIEVAAAPLGAQDETLTQAEAAFNQIGFIMQKIDKAITHWHGTAPMPHEIPGLYEKMMEVASKLSLPISTELLHDYRRRMLQQQKNFEAASTAAEESRGIMGIARQYIAEAAAALKRYLRRGF